MDNRIFISCLLLILFLFPSTGKSEVTLASPFRDHMVLQRNKPAAIWGTAEKGEHITIRFNSTSTRTIAGEDGKWMIYLPAMKQGGPYEMEIQGNNTLLLKDIYLGEVWLCSGQSNMVMTVAQEDRRWCGVYNEEEEVANAHYPMIRMYTVDFNTSDEPLDSCNGIWEVVSPETIGHLSATPYFFAKDLYNKYKVPVGLLVSAYGASTIETWTSREALEKNDRTKPLVDNYLEACEDYDIGHAMGRYRVALARWEEENKAHSNPEETPVARSQDISEKPVSKKPAQPRNPHTDQHSPYVCWNAMIHPLIPYTLQGAIWYQGESNGGTAAIYREQTEVMVRDWRERWRLGEFPFYYVQLANRGEPEDIPAKGGVDALVREAQLQSLSIRNTGMVVAIDNANPENPSDVHPKNKQEIGRRLALIARANVYGENKLVYSGPIYKNAEIIGNKVIIKFDHTGSGLVFKNGKAEGFAIAGRDGKFVWAEGKITGNSLTLWNDEITEPVEVYYGFGRNPLISLYNKEGLPASPFRTNK